MSRFQKLLLLASCLLTLVSTTFATPAQEPDLKAVIDGAIRWMRSQQDRETGAYGSVEETAWVLRALAESPRSYVRRDGPFVEDALEFLGQQQREDGAIVGKDGENVDSTTLYAIYAFERYSDPISERIETKAREFLKTIPPHRYPNHTEESAKKRAGQILEKRNDAGYWNVNGSSLIATSQSIIELTHIKKALAKNDSAPATTVKLPPFQPATRKEVLTSMNRGALFLLALGDDGKFGAPGKPDAGLTAMVLAALQCLPEPRPEEVQSSIDKGLAWLVSLQQKNGAIHDGKLPNYITSASILALRRSNKAEFQSAIERAQKFLVGLQADEGEGYDEGDLYYGGIGYGGDERPDLSNLQMALDALSNSKSPEAAEALKRAVKFLERTQNRSESNDVNVKDKKGATVRAGDDGGAAYYPGNSPAGYVTLADGTKVPRSYGSMTYSLLKGYIFAGVSKDDPRMQAAWKWICENYTLDVNPGFEHSESPMAAYQGLFYYFNTMARALDLFGEEVIKDADGVEHAWREQLCGRLIAMQNRENGSWLNENSPRWWEGNPLLSTAYVLLALDSALPPVAASDGNE